MIAAPLLVAAVLAGCSGPDGTTDEEEHRTIGLYSAVLRWFVAGTANEGTVFVTTAEEAELPLEVEVGIVQELDESGSTVRFIDELEEAIDDSVPELAVRGDGLLIALGSVSGNDPDRAAVYAERYVEVDRVTAYQLVLVRSDSHWEVDGEPREVPIRGLPVGDVTARGR